MNGMLADVMAEMLHRKGLLIYGLASLFGLLVVGVASTADIQFQMDGADQMPGDAVAMLSNPVLSAAGFYTGFLVFLTVLAISGLLPRLLEKGRVDYFFSKPLGRAQLVAFRIVAIFLVYGGLVAFSGLLVYGLGALLSGAFSPGYVSVLGIELAVLLVWLSVVSIVGLITGSQAVTMMAVFGVWISQYVLQFHEQIAAFLSKYEFVGGLTHALYWILPKTSQLSEIGMRLALGQPVESWAPLLTSLPFALLLLIVALTVVQRKDF